MIPRQHIGVRQGEVALIGSPPCFLLAAYDSQSHSYAFFIAIWIRVKDKLCKVFYLQNESNFLGHLF
jgi:hypothetical protein